MVRFFLKEAERGRIALRAVAGCAAIIGLMAMLPATPADAAKRPKETVKQPAPPDLLMDGGRKLSFERSFSLEREVKPKRSFWTKVVDIIAGMPDFHYPGQSLQRHDGFAWPHHRYGSGARRVCTSSTSRSRSTSSLTASTREQGSDADAAVRRGRCPGQYLRHRFAGGQGFRLRRQRQVSARHRKLERWRRFFQTSDRHCC